VKKIGVITDATYSYFNQSQRFTKVSMKILLITGEAGAGKTKLIGKRSNCHLIDPLGIMLNGYNL
jgi:hypothetical protein